MAEGRANIVSDLLSVAFSMHEKLFFMHLQHGHSIVREDAHE